ncbi:MAG: hypothetical protein KAJ66_00805 [Candidatus Omnitrophica bacterium]|nr:hypothetical protein [Candidatus Omnitrophota bacterium]
MNIAIDIDGVIADADTKFRSVMKERFKRDFPLSEVKTFHYEDSFEFSKDELSRLYEIFFDEGVWFDMKPLNNALDSIRKLAEDNRIIIATARPLEAKGVTLKWLNRYKVAYDEIYFTLSEKHLLSDKYNEKVDFFIEDHPNYTRRIADSGIKVIMFSYPWNDCVENHPNIYPVSSWEETMKIIKRRHKNRAST